MKTVLTSIITSIITVIIAMFIIHAVAGGGECIFSHDDDDEKECTERERKDCDKDYHKKDTEMHAMMMEKMKPMRIQFEEQLSDEEKASINDIRAKFGDADHKDMRPEGKEKFMDAHKADFEALLAIADNHKEYFEGMCAKMYDAHHNEMKEGEDHQGEDVDVKMGHKCPEVEKCKEATIKCKGAKTPEEEVKRKETEIKKCKEAEEKCEKECMNTFQFHFLLMDVG